MRGKVNLIICVLGPVQQDMIIFNPKLTKNIPYYMCVLFYSLPVTFIDTVSLSHNSPLREGRYEPFTELEGVA